jgi:hypothetical protein
VPTYATARMRTFERDCVESVSGRAMTQVLRSREALSLVRGVLKRACPVVRAYHVITCEATTNKCGGLVVLENSWY